MATKILIPTPLRPYTDKRDAVEAEGTTIGELLADLTRRHSGLKAHLYNEQGKLRSFVNVYLNDEDIRYLQKEQTPVSAGDTISIIPSVAGGKGDGQRDGEFVHLVICSSAHFVVAGCRRLTK
jgi:adenylyltransferase/sulfurtransferase